MKTTVKRIAKLEYDMEDPKDTRLFHLTISAPMLKKSILEIVKILRDYPDLSYEARGILENNLVFLDELLEGDYE